MRNGRTIEEVAKHFPPCGTNFPEMSGLDQTLSASGKTLAHEGAEKLGVTWSDAKHYAAARARWAQAGFPTRTDAEVARLVALCKRCNGWSHGRCKHCGCRINHGPALANKARMATETCPKAKWGGD